MGRYKFSISALKVFDIVAMAACFVTAASWQFGTSYSVVSGCMTIYCARMLTT
jgi:hypothetical protein